jgi:hypothetical protein
MYLTDDLLADLAYADIAFIIATAAASRVHIFTTGGQDSNQSLYPIIMGNGFMGNGFQVDFRQHPTLGTIGAFPRYGNGSQ